MTGQREALIIANGQYEHPGLARLMAPTADAEALSEVLGDPAVGNYAVQMAVDEPAHVIRERVEDFLSDRRPDDILLLHFSCHGLKPDSGKLYFAARDTRPNRPEATAVPAVFVQDCMRASRANSIVLLLDCCYGGAISPGVTVRAGSSVNVADSFPDASISGRGHVVITASNAMQYAIDGDELSADSEPRPSVFTEAVVEALTTGSGDADRDGDGWVSLSELYRYVYDKVVQRNPNQTPSRIGETQGELLLARTKHPRIRTGKLPPGLQAAIIDPNVFARRGAVHELESRLASEDLAVAAGAYQALAEVARTDIQYVADLAAAVLGQAAVRPEETELRFEQQQGSDPPHRMIRLLGLPIARACQAAASHPWLQAAVTPEGLDISMDTARPMTAEGQVNVTGPTGDAVIHVHAQVTPAPTAPSAPREGKAQASPEAADAIRGHRVLPIGRLNVPPDAQELRAIKDQDLEEYLKTGYSLKAGNRTLSTKRTPGPAIFHIRDEQGERTITEIGKLPRWVIDKLIIEWGQQGDSYPDPHRWLEALLARQTGSWGSTSSDANRYLDVSGEMNGPLKYIVTEDGRSREFAELRQVPDLDQFKPDLFRHLKRKADREAVQSRLDAMYEK